MSYSQSYGNYQRASSMTVDAPDFVGGIEEEEFEELELTGSEAEVLDQLIVNILVFVDTLAGHPLYPYEREVAYRLVESILLNDGAEITCLFSRQSGKTETMANVIAALVILLPKLAKSFPKWCGDFRRGFWVGCFAPINEQADTLFQRIKERLKSDTAKAVLSDPEIDDKVEDGSKTITFKNSGSLIRVQSANPKASVESKTYHLVIIDEAQKVDEKMVGKSIKPMLASTNGTTAYTGTPDYTKGIFYRTIIRNKDSQTRRGRKKNHFEFDWKTCAKYNPKYRRFVLREIENYGEESDFIQLSYCLKWIFDRGMFIVDSKFTELTDPTMDLVKEWNRSDIVLGIDPARKQDSTVVTALWVDWQNPDEFGYYDCRVLNWLEMQGEKWEEQYGRIIDFAANYRVSLIGIDAGGIGDVVEDRLTRLLPYANVVPFGANKADQSRRWKFMQTMIGRNRVGWPGKASARRTKTWKRFETQMLDAEKIYSGKDMLVAAPEGDSNHDDYVDSLSLAVAVTQAQILPVVQSAENPFFASRRR